MKLTTYNSSDKDPKITTYRLFLSGHHIMLDFGSDDIRNEHLSSIEYIFLTHEHFDHWGGLLDTRTIYKLDYYRVKIYATPTTKRLIQALFEDRFKDTYKDTDFRFIRSVLDKIIPVYFKQEKKLDEHLSFTYFRSGHTFGSAMVYINTPEAKILYTGDMDKGHKDVDRHYDVPSDLIVDYLIVDGTNLPEDFYKRRSQQKILEKVKKSDNGRFSIRAEKAPFMARQMMLIPEIKDHYYIVYERDLLHYLEKIYASGYDPFWTDEILLDIDDNEVPLNQAPIYLSSKNEKRRISLDHLIGLHISMVDFLDFLRGFQDHSYKILVGHYGYEDLATLKQVLQNYQHEFLFSVLSLGEQDV